MNGAHIHLLLNHIPVLGSIFSLCLLIYGCLTKKDIICNVALFTTVISALFCIPVYLSGDEAEHIVEPIIGINKAALDAHEEMAEIAFWLILMNGAIALATLVSAVKKKFHSGYLLWINAILLALTVALMARTAYVGGQVRHSEIGVVVSGDNE